MAPSPPPLLRPRLATLGLILRLTDHGRLLGWEDVGCAALLAARHVATRDPSVVPALANLSASFHLLPRLYDSRSSAAASLAAYRDAAAHGALVTVGPARSATLLPVALLAALDRRPVVSYWATSPALTNAELYPYHTRLMPSDAVGAAVLLRLLTQAPEDDEIFYGWRNIAVLHLSDAWGVGYVEQMILAAEGRGVSVRSFHFYEGDFTRGLERLVTSRLSVIVMLAFEGDILRILLQAQKLGLLDGRHAWILPEGTSLTSSIRSNPTHRHLLDGFLTLEPDGSPSAGHARFTAAWSALTPAACANPLFTPPNASAFSFPPRNVAAFLYDAVVATALALDAAADATNGSLVLASLRASSFEGASGLVAFSADGERRADSAAYVMRNLLPAAEGLRLRLVVRGGAAGLQLVAPIRWPGGGGEQPVDQVYLAQIAAESQLQDVFLRVVTPLAVVLLLLLAYLHLSYFARRSPASPASPHRKELLALFCNPTLSREARAVGLRPLSFGQELKHLLRAMDLRVLAIEPAATLDDARAALCRHCPRVLVFSGHTFMGSLAFEDDGGRMDDHAHGDQFVSLLTSLGKEPRKARGHAQKEGSSPLLGEGRGSCQKGEGRGSQLSEGRVSQLSEGRASAQRVSHFGEGRGASQKREGRVSQVGEGRGSSQIGDGRVSQVGEGRGSSHSVEARVSQAGEGRGSSQKRERRVSHKSEDASLPKVAEGCSLTTAEAVSLHKAEGSTPPKDETTLREAEGATPPQGKAFASWHSEGASPFSAEPSPCDRNGISPFPSGGSPCNLETPPHRKGWLRKGAVSPSCTADGKEKAVAATHKVELSPHSEESSSHHREGSANRIPRGAPLSVVLARLEGIVLNGCKTEAIGRQLLKVKATLAVVCWTTLAEDNAARIFSNGFYTSLQKYLREERRRPPCASCASRRRGARRTLMEEAFHAGCMSFLASGYRFGDPEEYFHPRGHPHEYHPDYLNCTHCTPPVHGECVLLRTSDGGEPAATYGSSLNVRRSTLGILQHELTTIALRRTLTFDWPHRTRHLPVLRKVRRRPKEETGRA